MDKIKIIKSPEEKAEIMRLNKIKASKRYYEANRDKMKAYKRKYYLEHKIKKVEIDNEE